MMQHNQSIKDPFEPVANIEPSPGWEENLLRRIDRGVPSGRNTRTPRLLLSVLALLLVINVFAFTRLAILHKRQEHKQELRDVAGEFLITTSSSKY